MSRRSLSPETNPTHVLAQRRSVGGARREISARVIFRSDTREYEGWSLNISRGGLRAIIEERVDLGQVLTVEGCDTNNFDAPQRTARVVWCQDEPDGSVVGLEFLDTDDFEPTTEPKPRISTTAPTA